MPVGAWAVLRLSCLLQRWRDKAAWKANWICEMKVENALGRANETQTEKLVDAKSVNS